MGNLKALRTPFFREKHLTLPFRMRAPFDFAPEGTIDFCQKTCFLPNRPHSNVVRWFLPSDDLLQQQTTLATCSNVLR
jgi:hypothetical protein